MGLGFRVNGFKDLVIRVWRVPYKGCLGCYEVIYMAPHPSSIATHAEYRSSSHMLLLKKQSDVLGPAPSSTSVGSAPCLASSFSTKSSSARQLCLNFCEQRLRLRRTRIAELLLPPLADAFYRQWQVLWTLCNSPRRSLPKA